MTNELITWHKTTLLKEDRRQLNQHTSSILWFTGLSGSGKSTLANAVNQKLHDSGVRSYVLDGDNIRHGLNHGLGFSAEDRQENIRRVGEVAKLFVDSGQFALTAFISPFRVDRDRVRRMVEAKEFIEIYVRCPLQECETRDPKGLYQKAKSGEISNFTGISSPYEEPLAPELIIDTSRYSINNCTNQIIAYLEEKSLLPQGGTNGDI